MKGFSQEHSKNYLGGEDPAPRRILRITRRRARIKRPKTRSATDLNDSKKKRCYFPDIYGENGGRDCRGGGKGAEEIMKTRRSTGPTRKNTNTLKFQQDKYGTGGKIDPRSSKSKQRRAERKGNYPIDEKLLTEGSPR